MSAYAPYATPTFAQLKQSLALRLNNSQFWTDAELGVYITESLRTWNSLTGIWLASFVFQTANGGTWYFVPSLNNSPRPYTVTDTDIYTAMEYHLLEPPTGGAWTGTSQFTIAQLSQALQRQRDWLMQHAALGVNNIQVAWSDGRRFTLPDSVMEVERLRFVPAPTSPLKPTTLYRSDAKGIQFYNPGYLQNNVTGPRCYDVVGTPPLAVNIDNLPLTPGNFDAIVLQKGPQFNPPTPTLMGIPDDLTWIAKWGALADVLSAEPEATDRTRADYCRQRYEDGLKIAASTPWLSVANINGIPVDTSSMAQIDQFGTEWQNNPNQRPCVVIAGVDYIGICPTPGTIPVGVNLTVLGNAPVPQADDDDVQIGPDVIDVIIDYSQHLAAFKMGGLEFQGTAGLMKNFMDAATKTNNRLANLGLFDGVMHAEGHRQQEVLPRIDG